jgi:hypothetical protein
MSRSRTVARDRAVKHGASRLLTYAPPWVVWLLLPILATIGYLLWGRSPTWAPWFSMLSFGLVVALTGWTWRLLEARDDMLQRLGTVSVGVAGMWFIVASLVGWWTRGVVDAWGFGGFGACLFWTIRRAVLNGALEQGETGKETALQKALGGARISKPREIDGRVVAQVEVKRGEQTVKDLQGQREHLAGVLGVRPEAVRIAPNPKDAGKAEMVIVPNDPLEGVIPWPGPSAPGQSIADAPIPIGVYEDMLHALIWLCGDDAKARALAHWLIMGMNGAGKSQAWVMAMADALTRNDFALWGSDHVKGVQTFGPLADAMDRHATTLADAKKMIAAARDVAAYQQNELGKLGYKQWEKGCPFPLLMVWIEEASEVVSDSQSFVRLVERARSAGVVIVASLQRASHDNIDTSARAQLAASLCFGVRDHTDATFALPDNVLDAGAAPDSWGNRRPGYFYLVAPGVDEERWAVPGRTYRAFDAEIADVLAEWAHVRAPMHPGSERIALAAWPRTSPDRASTGGSVPPHSGDADGVDEEGVEPMPPELEPEFDVDPDQPIAPPPADIPFGQPAGGGKLSTERARAVVQQHLRTLVEQGRTHTQPADVCKMKPATTRSREWVRKEMDRLCTAAEAGEIALERDYAEVPGVFRIVAPVPAGV